MKKKTNDSAKFSFLRPRAIALLAPSPSVPLIRLCGRNALVLHKSNRVIGTPRLRDYKINTTKCCPMNFFSRKNNSNELFNRKSPLRSPNIHLHCELTRVSAGRNHPNTTARKTGVWRAENPVEKRCRFLLG